MSQIAMLDDTQQVMICPCVPIVANGQDNFGWVFGYEELYDAQFEIVKGRPPFTTRILYEINEANRNEATAEV